MADWDDDNARQSNDLSDDGEDPAVKAVEVVTTDPGCYDALSNHYNESNNIVGISQFHDDGCRIGDLSELDERDERDEYNVYECLAYEKEEESNNVCCDRLEELDVKSMGALANSRLFEQLIQSGYLNYGFYSFSLAKFIDDQTNLTDYLSLVSSSTGISYYLDLEFKLKQRHQTTPQTSLSSAYASTNYSSSSTTNSFAFHFRNVSGDGLSLNGSYQNYFYTNNDTLFDSSSLNSNSKLNNFSFSLLSQRIKRNHSISNCSNESQTNISIHNHQQQHSFTNNMIAKLASSNGAPSQKASSGQTKANAISSASQSKRKRSKLLDLLLNTNWSKQSQQASNLMKLNKVLLVCDANFLDEKTGESPLSLVITSPQINETQVTTKTNRIRTTAGATTTNGCPQSTSLFDLQSQHSTTSHNMLSLQQTSAVELSQSKAPLVEKVLLLLIKSGALIDFRNNDGRTPLHIAAMKSNFWALKTLLDLGK